MLHPQPLDISPAVPVMSLTAIFCPTQDSIQGHAFPLVVTMWGSFLVKQLPSLPLSFLKLTFTKSTHLYFVEFSSSLMSCFPMLHLGYAFRSVNNRNCDLLGASHLEALMTPCLHPDDVDFGDLVKVVYFSYAFLI